MKMEVLKRTRREGRMKKRKGMGQKRKTRVVQTMRILWVERRSYRSHSKDLEWKKRWLCQILVQEL